VRPDPHALPLWAPHQRKLDRYIPVDTQGQWGFLDALNELFRHASITADELRLAGARPEWFDRSFLASQNLTPFSHGKA
jgi:hypothetical protein